MSRDQFGQVKGKPSSNTCNLSPMSLTSLFHQDRSIALYRYTEGLVHEAITAMQDTVVAVYTSTWDGWLRSEDDALGVRLRTMLEDPSTQGAYENADSFVRMLKLSENSVALKSEMVQGYKRSQSHVCADCADDEWEGRLSAEL